MNTIWAYNIPHAYTEAIHKMRIWSEEETSRNGPVFTSPDPVMLEISDPTQRVLFDSVRDANPFFHVMEFIWMMTGSNDVKFPEIFNRRFRDYADSGTDTLHGAYGHRWRRHFDIDQIFTVIGMLRKDPTTRRAVIGMWDPRVDLDPHNDLPCNTQIMFRFVEESLDMTVINRSNDLIWGMMGANAVHMTLLHELVAGFAGLRIGTYRVFTNNLHVYKDMPNFEAIWGTIECRDEYRGALLRDEKHYPVVNTVHGFEDTYEDFVGDCKLIVVDGKPGELRCNWIKAVAWPMKMAYLQRKNGGTGYDYMGQINALDWRLACTNWIQRREEKKKMT